METKPFAQPTAMSVAESQVREVHRVLGGRAVKEASSYLTNTYINLVGLDI